MEQTFQSAEGLAAVAWVKALFRERSGNIPPQSIVDRVQPGVKSPPMPESIAIWNTLTREKLQARS